MSAKIATALHEVMSKVSYVQKTGKNAFHNYRYAGEADLLEKLRPAMLEAGLLLIPSISDVSPIDEHGVTTVRMEYMLMHKDGDVWPHKIGAAGQGGDRNKNGVGDKGLYKAITGANKYLLFKLFQIETGDDPEATEMPAPVKRQNPHVTRAEDILPSADYDANGEVIDNIPHAEPTEKLRVADQRPLYDALQKEARAFNTSKAFLAWMSAPLTVDRVKNIKPDWQAMFRGVCKDHLADLRQGEADFGDTRMAG